MQRHRKSEEQRQYDELAKKLIAKKDVLANILHYAVREFQKYSVQEIITFIDGEPEIGKDDVDDKIIKSLDAAGGESVSFDEGIRTYDIKFKVKVPQDGGKKSESSELIINIEAQNKYNPGYTLERRGVYYLSRLISSQYGVEFTGSDFNDLKKVYSIWICLNSPKKYQNTISEYSFSQTHIVGNAPDKKLNYDLMSLIMICLGSAGENYDGLIKLLDNLLNKMATEPINALKVVEEEYKIPIIDREVSGMCNLSDGIYERGIKKGVQQGMQQGMQQGIQQGIEETKIKMISKLLNKGFSLDDALDTIELNKSEYEEYKKKYTDNGDQK